MTPELTKFFRETSPVYQKYYTEGFEAGKLCALKEMKEALKTIKNKEAFVTSTGTHSI